MEFDLITLISQVGFPIAVAGFVLVRLDHTLKDLRDEIVSLNTEFRRLCERIS